MEFTIRPASLNDAAAIAEINVAAWKAAYPGIVPQTYLDRLDPEEKLARISQRLSERGNTLVLESGTGQVAGYTEFGGRRDGPEEISGEVYALYLLPGIQGQGMGTRLFRAAARQLHSQNHRTLCVWVLENNRRARVFYERLGGAWLGRQTFEIDEETIPEVVYGWTDLADLLECE